MSEVREIPIFLHDGTIVRKKKEKDSAKRISEIIIEINKDGRCPNERRNGPDLDDLRNEAQNLYKKADKLEQRLHTLSQSDLR